MGCSCILTKLLTDSHQYTHIPQTASIDFHSNRRHGKSAGRPFYTEQVHMAGKRLKKRGRIFTVLILTRKYQLLMLS